MDPAPSPPAHRRQGFRFLIAGLIVWVLALVVGIGVLAATGGGPAHIEGRWDEQHVQGSGDDRIAIVDISGDIATGTGTPLGVVGGGGSLTADDYISMLRQARADDSIAAVIVRIDSPGGSVVGSAAISRMIQQVARAKPVVALLGEEAASGGFYIACAADEIVADPDTITGDIGVIAMFPNLEGAGNKIGAHVVVIKSGRLKDIGSPFRAMTTEERRILQAMVDQAYGRFIDVVAKGRGKTRAEVIRLAGNGTIYTGEQAASLDLVDSLGGLDDAVARAKSLAHHPQPAEVIRYVPSPIGFGGFVARALMKGPIDLPQIERAAGVRAGLQYLWLG